jgi:hypothetical protein
MCSPSRVLLSLLWALLLLVGITGAGVANACPPDLSPAEHLRCLCDEAEHGDMLCNIYLVLLTLLELKHRKTINKLQNGIVELLIKGTQRRSSGSGQCTTSARAFRKALSSLKCGSFYPLCRGTTMLGKFVTQRSGK